MILLTIIIISVAVAVLSLLTYLNLELRSLPDPPDLSLRAEEPVPRYSRGSAVSPARTITGATRDSPTLLRASSQAGHQERAGA